MALSGETALVEAKARPDWQVRVIEERYDLSERLGRLLKFITLAGLAYQSLTDEEKNLLDEQAAVMRRFVRVLDKRIAAFTV